MTSGEALAAILDRAERAGWAGADPYDALLSPLGRLATPFGPVARIAVQQAALRVPGFRYLAKAPPTVNPKGLGLFLGAAVRGRTVLGEERTRSLARSLLGELRARVLANDDPAAPAWGYPFPWQSRWLWAPVGTPNAVVTATVGLQLLEYGDALGDRDATALGVGAARFIARGPHRTRFADGALAISYTPRDRSRIINVSALGARLVARALGADDGDAFGDAPAREDARQLVRGVIAYAVETQRPDGTWPYAPDPRGGWVDSFHTGYILESLLELRARGETVPEDALARGFAAYAGFFDDEGGGRLLAEETAPYDGHSTGQGVLTYAALARAGGVRGCTVAEAHDRALRIARWALDQLWLPKRGYFAYRINRGTRDERDFTRWVQAWMALAMATAAGIEAASDVEAGSMDREHTRVGV